jgi:hypothetical protein
MGGLPFQNMGGNPFQNMGGNPLGFLNQNNLGGQNKYLPQLARVIGNRLGYPQQGGGTKFERPSQQNELQQTGRFAGMPKVLTGSYGAYPGSRQFLTGERDDDPGTAPGWVRPQQNGGVDYRSLFGGGALPNLKDVISKFGPSAPSMSDAEFQRQMAEERKAIAERQARGDYSDNIYHTM